MVLRQVNKLAVSTPSQAAVALEGSTNPVLYFRPSGDKLHYWSYKYKTWQEYAPK